MTQNTQTTVERLLALIANNQQTIRTGSIKLIDHGRAANLIAAEIDRLTAERNEARAKLKECDDSTDFVQGLREAEQATLSNTQRLLGVAHTELAEARAALSAWRTMFPVNTPAEIAAKLMRGG